MRKLIVTAVALVALTHAGAASAGGHIKTVRQNVFYDWVRYRITYRVFDSRGHCVKDEDGFYSDERCLDYDRGVAPVDMLVMRMGPHPRIVYDDLEWGAWGRATLEFCLLCYQPSGCSRTVITYRVILRLRDPIRKRVYPDTRVKTLRYYCR